MSASGWPEEPGESSDCNPRSLVFAPAVFEFCEVVVPSGDCEFLSQTSC